MPSNISLLLLLETEVFIPSFRQASPIPSFKHTIPTSQEKSFEESGLWVPGDNRGKPFSQFHLMCSEDEGRENNGRCTRISLLSCTHHKIGVHRQSVIASSSVSGGRKNPVGGGALLCVLFKRKVFLIFALLLVRTRVCMIGGGWCSGRWKTEIVLKAASVHLIAYWISITVEECLGP